MIIFSKMLVNVLMNGMKSYFLLFIVKKKKKKIISAVSKGGGGFLSSQIVGIFKGFIKEPS